MTAKYTVIFLLQRLGFIISFKKSLLKATQKIEILGLFIDSVELTLSLTPQKPQVTSSISFELTEAQHRQRFQRKKQLRYLQQAQIQVLN